MNAKLSPVTSKWIALRAEKIGKSARILQAAGFWKHGFAELNNRHGSSHMMPCSIKSLPDFKELFVKLEAAGFVGIAFQFTDIQWKHNAALTDAQWQGRVMIG